MTSQLPATLIDHITHLLLPRIHTVEDRKTLCLEAYSTTHGWLRQYINYGNNAREFTINILNIFIEFGSYLAEPLFFAMRSSYGSDIEIRQRLSEFQTACAALPVVPSTIGDIPPANDPAAPTIYLSHSDGDTGLAQQIAAILQQHGRHCVLGPTLEKGRVIFLHFCRTR